ncbi:hypothetical protein [Corynebacterium neomassiliense]|uniref:hypothetical protein n=1 Tax=Corynebacterium neomassiliense TaxID=2079482 RepID=UPI00102FD1E9|nr:hypothetical protein [Corynebacterium neomassiliense]
MDDGTGGTAGRRNRDDVIGHLEQEDRRAAVKMAWQWGLGVPVLTVAVYLVLRALTGDSTLTHAVPVIVSLAGAVGVCVVTSRRWSRYHAWAPLMGAVWALIPWFLLVATTLLQKLILGE